MKNVIIVALLLAMGVPALPQSAKKLKAEIRAKVEAKVQTVDAIDGIVMELKLAQFFLTYNQCEKHWNHLGIRGWFQDDPCKAQLKKLAEIVK